MRKLGGSLAVAPILVILMTVGAQALCSTTGQGLTHDGASLGFNAKKNLQGHLTYISHSSDLKVFCKGYTSYQEWVKQSGQPISRVRATCVDQDGTTIYVKAYFIDKGEPGTNDIVRIYFSYNASYAKSPENDPSGISDVGVIQTGNVQIHPTHTALVTAQCA